MRTVIYIIAGALLFLVLLAESITANDDHELNLDVMVEAIRQAENWDGSARGAAGELGPWQTTPAVWAEVSDKPFAWAEGHTPTERSEARRVAREKIYRIAQRLKVEKCPVDAYTIALVWGAGWNAFYYHLPHAPSKAKRSYADRAANLYYAVSKDTEIEHDFRPPYKITDEGLKALGQYQPIPEGQALLEYWLRELGDSGAARMLRALAEVYPKAISRDELGERAGMSAGSGTFATYLGRLRTLELVDGRGDLKASDELFN